MQKAGFIAVCMSEMDAMCIPAHVMAKELMQTMAWGTTSADFVR